MTAIAACGSGGGPGGSAAAGGSAAPATTSLTVAYAATGAGFSDLYVGVADGIFKRYGLNVSLVQVTPANLIPALLSGSAQIGGGVADGAAAAILKGEKLKYVALSEGTYNLQLWANKGISSPQDLVGKTVALTTQGSETDFGLTAMLQSYGISPAKVARKYLVTAAQMLSAMHSGAVQAGLFQPPTAQTLTETGGKVVASLSSLPYAVGAYTTTASYAAANPGVIAKFIAAEKANLAYLRSNPSQTMAAIQQFNSTSTAAGNKIAYSFFLQVWKKDPTITPALIEAAFARAAQNASTTAPSDISQYIFSAPAAR
ncbi:MAG TPA: ABC transporter substrate-binding protein [Trebonia sp.]|nr:ABC transporter substrate-binding protein [Trebonia sp.]